MSDRDDTEHTESAIDSSREPAAPKHRVIMIRTQLGENPIIFKICEFGANLGYIATLTILWISWMALAAATFYVTIEFFGFNFTGIIIAFAAVISLGGLLIELEKRHSQLWRIWDGLTLNSIRRGVHKLLCAVNLHDWGKLTDGEFCYWCSKSRDE